MTRFGVLRNFTCSNCTCSGAHAPRCVVKGSKAGKGNVFHLQGIRQTVKAETLKRKPVSRVTVPVIFVSLSSMIQLLLKGKNNLFIPTDYNC